MAKILLLLLFSISGVCALHEGRRKRDYGNGSPVCVCDSEYCDFVEPVEPIGEREAVVYLSDISGRRLERGTVKVKPADGKPVDVTLYPSKKYQEIQGFGGAFTDAAGINIASLPEGAQDLLLRSYFSKEGLEYNIGRIPLASTDFSTRKYSYADTENDFQLKEFSLQEEDYKYKIPFIKSAQKYSSQEIKFFGTSWSAPAWMKTGGTMDGNGTLLGDPSTKDKYYAAWANYYVKFLQEYAKQNITFWALTAQNEPTTGFLYKFEWQTQGFKPEMQRDFIKHHLGPSLHNNGFDKVSLMILDDQRIFLPAWPRRVLNDRQVRKYVSHIAVHWYTDQFVPTETLDTTHDEFPNYPLFATESSASENGLLLKRKKHVILGNWETAERYCHHIIQDLNHWFVGWTDWNLALDLQGGPNLAENFVDSAIIVNATAGEFYKQPAFYAMGHFSKFLPPKSHRIGYHWNTEPDQVELTAFLNPNGYKTVVFLNKNGSNMIIRLGVDGKKEVIDVDLPPRSMATVIWP